MHHRPSQIPQASQIPRRSSSAEPPLVTPTSTMQHHSQNYPPPAASSGASSSQMNWQPANLALQNMNMIRESMSNRQSSIGRASSVSRASMVKPNDPSKNVNAFELAQSISFTLQTFQLDYSPKVLLNPNTSTFYSVFEYLVQVLGFNNVWNVAYLTTQQQANNNGQNKPGGMSSSQPQNQAQNNAALNKQRTELIIFFLNFFEYPSIPKPSVFSTMTTPKNWICMLQILFYLSNIVKFLSLINVTKIIYHEEKNREFINMFLKNIFARTATVPDFVNSEEFKQQKQEALNEFRDKLEKNLNWDQIMAEKEELTKQFEQLHAGKNELEDLQKEEERLKREMEAEEAGLKKRQEKIDEMKKKLAASRKEQVGLVEKLRVSQEENAAKEREYEKQAASEILKQELPKLHKHILHELDTLENAVFDLDNKQAELQDKYANINDQLKSKIAEANDLVTRIRTDSLIDVSGLKGIDASLDFGRTKLMPLSDYKDLIHKVRKDFNDKICRLPQKTSEAKEQKNAVSCKLETAKAKSVQLELETKKFDAQLNDLKKKSENALTDAKLKVSQTKNEQLLKERELKAKEEEAAAQMLKMKNNKEAQEKILKEYDAKTDEIAEEFAEEYIKLLSYKDDKERDFNLFKQTELARNKEIVRERKERNEETRKRLLAAGFNVKTA